MARIWDRLVLALGTGFYLGRIPPSGTVGGLWGIPLTIGLHREFNWAGSLIVIAGLCLLGVYLCGRSATLIGAKDPSEVVFDEIATIPIVFLPIADLSWLVLAVGFTLHRIWDATKPLGIKHLQRLPGGWGIMIDDVVAAAAAGVCLYLVVQSGLLELGGS